MASRARRPLLAALLAAWTAAAPLAARAAPTVSIRAHTEVRVTAVRRTPDGLRVSGVLVDRATAVGLPDQPVSVTILGHEGRGTTQEDGVFDILVPAADGSAPVDVGVAFGGDDRLDPAQAEERGVDPSKAPVTLTITATPTATGALVTVSAAVDQADVRLPVSLTIAATEGGRPPRTLDFSTGSPQLVSRAQAGGAGVKHLGARFAGDATHAAATAEATFTFTTATRIDLAVGSKTVAFEGTVKTKGKVLDDDGNPIAGVAVAVTADDARVGATTTGADGTYKLSIAADRLGVGRKTLQAAVESKDAWRTSSRSGPAFVTIGTPRPAPNGITITAFAITALAALLFILARRRRDRAMVLVNAPPATAADPVGGLEPARASIVSTLRRASDHGFAGLVRDAVRSRPLATAEVRLSRDGQDMSTVTDADGRFALEQLAPGEWRARVSAAGHVSERFMVTVPHRGELRGVHIDLVPVREKVWSLYRRAAQPKLPNAELWGIWSPRQIVDHVRTGAPTPAFSDLTSFVEETFFSARVPEEAVLPGAEQKVQAALAERGAGVPALHLRER
ncbi:MAG TPA: carboxypeptidase-like regulatory domain-containing protein [Kofleriaceae bacterium]|nr:carboxypeptidase-like regulatory domain-containing protein [Kofleriaceae bacterium]